MTNEQVVIQSEEEWARQALESVRAKFASIDEELAQTKQDDVSEQTPDPKETD